MTPWLFEKRSHLKSSHTKATELYMSCLPLVLAVQNSPNYFEDNEFACARACCMETAKWTDWFVFALLDKMLEKIMAASDSDACGD